jgi:predicted ATPase
VSHGKDVPLLAYLGIVRGTFGITDHDEPATARDKVVRRFATFYPELNEYVPVLLDLFGVADPEHPAPPMTPDERLKRLFEWQRRAAERRGSRESLVIVVEDCHWIDPASEVLVGELIAARKARQLVVVTYRPEYRPPWVGKPVFHQLPLGPLTEASVDELLEGLLGPEAAGSELALTIRKRCGGTPFFAEELVQSLAEAGALAGDRGAYRVTPASGTVPLPASVKVVLASRIDRLEEAQKASVIGRTFPRDLLAAVLGDSDSALDDVLRALADADLVYEEAIYPELEYAFKHPLTQEVAYESQLRDHRRRAHRRVAQQLEARYADKLDEKAALVASIWKRVPSSWPLRNGRRAPPAG